MKNKPVSHKNENTFRFRTFSERLSSINIDVIHRIGKTTNSPDGNTYFQEAVGKWNELNYTRDYDALKRDIGSQIHTLPQVMHRQEELVSVLLCHLQNPANMALDAILELVVALARDLLHRFYPYFPKFFVALTGLLETRDTDLLERIFTSLSYLFKILWKYMLIDIEDIYRLYSSLFHLENKEHIRNFAAESFAFLIRKVQDKPKLFAFIFCNLHLNPKHVEGVGQLLFEVVKGVKQQLHSCTKEVLKQLFNCLGGGTNQSETGPSNANTLVVETLTHTLGSIQKHIRKQYAQDVEEILHKTLKELVSTYAHGNQQHVLNHLYYILDLLYFWVQYKNGLLLHKNAETVQVLISISKLENLPDNCIKLIMDISAFLLVSKSIVHDTRSINLILDYVYSCNNSTLVFQFTRTMFSYGMFEKDILPRLLRHSVMHIDNSNSNSLVSLQILEILTESILHLRPFSPCWSDIRQFKKLNFISDYMKESSSLEDPLKNVMMCYLNGVEESSLPVNLPQLWCCIVCLPHFKYLDVDSARECFLKVSKYCHSKFLCTETNHDPSSLTFVILQAFASWLCIGGTFESNFFSLETFAKLVENFPKDISALQMLNLYLGANAAEEKFDNVFGNLMPKLLENLSSPFHKVRLYTLEILNSFSYTLPENEEGIGEEHSMFQICLNAERTPALVSDYREKMKFLRQLDFPSVLKHLPNELAEEGLKAVIHFLLGSLYVNFSLMWQPTLELLSSYANYKSEVFWSVFKPHLYFAIEEVEKISMVDEQVKPFVQFDMELLFVKMLDAFCKHSDNPDIVKHRLLLWKSMLNYTHIVKLKSHDVVPLLFRYIEKEVVKVDSLLATSESVACDAGNTSEEAIFVDSDSDDEDEGKEDDEISKSKRLKLSHNGDITHESIDDGEEDKTITEFHADDCDNKTDVVSPAKRKRSSVYKRQHNVVKTLASILTVFSKLKKPNNIHRSSELVKLYYELLCYPDLEIQKISFDCIMTHNYSFLTPYKENFCKILDDKTFKTEIVLFSIDKDNPDLQEVHRKSALDVLMRILFGKMHCKAGKNTPGKSHSHTRKMLVLRFLAGCHAEELHMFLNLVFDPIKEHLDEDVLHAVLNIQRNINLSSVVPIRKLNSTLNTVEIILHNLGGLVPELLPLFFKVLLIVGSFSSSLLRQRGELLPHCCRLIKSVRKQTIMIIIKFFKCFDHYTFTSAEMDALFEALVWPALPKFEFEAMTLPPPLLRLFDTWCSNSRFFPLLSKTSPSDNISPISKIMCLYTGGRARPRVVGLILKMIHSLLTLGEHIESEDALDMHTSGDTTIQGHKAGVTDGLLLLLPYASSIMERLQVVISKSSTNRKRSLDSQALTILLKMSSYIDEKDKCRRFIELLLPFFTHNKKLTGECEVLVLSTVINLLKKIDDVQHFVRLLAPLLNVVSHSKSRQLLTKAFTALAQIDENLKVSVDIVCKINAYNQNILEEPDYKMRLDGHTEALVIVDKMDETFDLDFLQILIFNSTFMIRTIDDLSLRDSSSYLLQQLVKRFSKVLSISSDVFKILVFETLLPELRRGLKNDNDVVRIEFIKILSSLLHSCGSHAQLTHLAQLCDNDPDMDFWQNIIHLQVHRRARALLKFSSSLNSAEMPPHILMAYMLPLVSSFLFDSAYVKHIHVVDAAVETLGSVVRHLPWAHYKNVLKHFLNLLPKKDYHKTAIKVIVAVLNSFHFDLSACKEIGNDWKEQKSKKADKEAPLDEKIPDMDVLMEDEVNKSKNKSESDNEKQAAEIHRVIACEILPQLHRSLMHKTKSDDEHKLSGAYYPEDEDILRVPIALAIVKLLQNLPRESLQKRIPGLFLRMCQLLKSKTESIRETARDTVVKMMDSLGPTYFWYLLNEMRGVMKKGYQVHVMTFTVNAILQKLKSQFKSGDLDSCINDLTEVCMNELFGETADEKEVAKITGKLKEARSSKSFAIYEILSQYVSEAKLMDLIVPLRDVLVSTRSHKAVKKIQECLRHIAIGISENSEVSVSVGLLFIHGLMAENVPHLSTNKKPSKQCKEEKYVRPDIYLIEKEPGRSGFPVKSSVKTNMHVLVDFSLQLLHLNLKRDKLSPTAQENLEMLDPFIHILSDCLDSNYIKIISAALRCLLWLFKFSLPALKTRSSSIVNSSFILLNKYAGIGMGQGENFEMVVMCFKMLTIIVRDTNYHTLSTKQLHILLSYIEQDIYDHTRQAAAFTLLKALLSKKLQAPELSSVMTKISEMAITFEQEHIRSQCRQVSLQYVMNYSTGKTVFETLSFYVRQLEYALEHGRKSAFEMINSMMNTFTSDILKKHCGFIFVAVSARLVNDDSEKCRQTAIFTIKNLLKKIDHDGRNNLFSLILVWLKDKKLPHRRLGTQLFGLFAEVEGQNFERFLPDVLSIVKNELVQLKSYEEKSATDVRCKDHFLYHMLNAYMRVVSNCKFLRNHNFIADVNEIWEHVQQFVLHSHVWVRLVASQLFGLFFASCSPDEVLECVDDASQTEIFFASRQKLRDLSADFATQLQSPYLDDVMGEQVIRNLVYLAKIISRLPEVLLEEKVQNIEVTLSWMVRKLCREVKKEVSNSPQNYTKRKCVFKFLAAIAIDLPQDVIFPLLPDIFLPLCREISDSSSHPNDSFKSLTQEVLDIFKNVTGAEVFSKVYAAVQSSLGKKKLKRKQERVQEAVTNPEKFAKKRIKKQVNKKNAKKRKILQLKGKKKKPQKKTLSSLAIGT